MRHKASPVNLWLEVPSGPPLPHHLAKLTLAVARGADTVVAHFDPEEAAAIGRRLLDWAARADPVTAVSAVGVVLRERPDVTGLASR